MIENVFPNIVKSDAVCPEMATLGQYSPLELWRVNI